jgi:hypothetical protein
MNVRPRRHHETWSLRILVNETAYNIELWGRGVMRAVLRRLRGARALAVTAILLTAGAMLVGFAGASPALAAVSLTPQFCQTSTAGNYCLDDGNGANGPVDMYEGGKSNENFVAQRIGLCGGTVSGNCPFDNSVFDTGYHGMPIVQLYDQSADKCVATSSAGAAVLGTCNAVSTGKGGGTGTVFIDDQGRMISLYWTDVDGAAYGGNAACMSGSAKNGGAVSLTLKTTAGCPQWTFGRSAIVDYAVSIMNGTVQYNPGYDWPGGALPYGYDGGHDIVPGPSPADCTGDPDCNNNGQISLDCSGFTRWVYYLAYGSDVLSDALDPEDHSNTVYQMGEMQNVTGSQAPGDLVFFAPNGTPNAPDSSGHVGIYISNDEMIDEYETGRFVETDSISGVAKSQGMYVMGYYRLATSS